MDSKQPFPIPVNYFSISLGLLSLGLAWRSAAVWGMPQSIGETVLAAGGVSWGLFVLIYLYKCLYRRENALAELYCL